MTIILPTAQGWEQLYLLVPTEYVTPFYFLAWGQGPILSRKCSILFIISITLYLETVNKVHDVDFTSYHFQGNSVEMTEYPIIFMLFVQF